MFAALIAAAPAAAAERSPVPQQRYDTSCGLAALAYLLNEAGIPVDEHLLFETYKRHVLKGKSIDAAVNQEGLTAAELVKIVEALGKGVFVTAWMLNPSDFDSRLNRHPVIAFVAEGTEKANFARGHFTAVVGFDPRRGYLRADSAVGKYVFHDQQAFYRAAQVGSSEKLILTLAVQRNDGAAQRQVPISPSEIRELPDLDAARLLKEAGISGVKQTRVALVVQRFSVRQPIADAHGAALDVSGPAAALVVQHTTGGGIELAGGMSLASRDVDLRLDELEISPISLSRKAVLGAGSLSLARNVDLGLPAPYQSSLQASAALSRKLGIRSLGGELTVSGQAGSAVALSGSASLSISPREHGWTPTAGATIGMSRSLGRSLTGEVGAWGAKTFGRDGEAVAGLSAALGRPISRTLAIGIFGERALLGPRGSRFATLGLSLSYTLPRKLAK